MSVPRILVQSYTEKLLASTRRRLRPLHGLEQPFRPTTAAASCALVTPGHRGGEVDQDVDPVECRGEIAGSAEVGANDLDIVGPAQSLEAGCRPHQRANLMAPFAQGGDDVAAEEPLAPVTSVLIVVPRGLEVVPPGD